MGMLDRLMRVFSNDYRFSGRGGGGSNYALRTTQQPSTRFNWLAEVGEIRQNPIVAIGLDWISRNTCSVPLKLYKKTRYGDEVELEGHPILDLLKNPNPFYSGSTLLQMTIADILTVGSGYWVAVMNNGGRLAELFWMDARYVAPDFPNSGEEYLYGWKYTPAGTGMVEEYPADRVVDFKRSYDPYNDRIGYTPLAAVMKEMAIVNISSSYTAAVLKNTGVASMIITPAEGTIIPKEKLEILKQDIANAIGLDSRGEPLMLNAAVDIQSTVTKPYEMMLKDIDASAVSRICAAMGLSPMLLGLPDQGKTYSNYREAQRAAWLNVIIPTHDLILESIQYKLVKLYDPSGSLCLRYDYSDVEALSEDRKTLAEEAKMLYESGICTQNEARLRVGLPETEDGDAFKTTSNSGTGNSVLPQFNGEYQEDDSED